MPPLLKFHRSSFSMPCGRMDGTFGSVVTRRCLGGPCHSLCATSRQAASSTERSVVFTYFATIAGSMYPSPPSFVSVEDLVSYPGSPAVLLATSLHLASRVGPYRVSYSRGHCRSSEKGRTFPDAAGPKVRMLEALRRSSCQLNRP